ncbi:hypothetical protein D3C76_1283020 [compost metagenome]
MWSTTAPPCEKPARKIREASIPLAFCVSISSMIQLADSSNCSRLIARAGLMANMSYQLGISYPPLMVTARLGAWGKTKRVLNRVSCRASATGRKS